MRVLFFGDRNLTWRHLPVLRALAAHSIRIADYDLAEWLGAMGRDMWPGVVLPESESLVMIHGDGPPGTGTPGAIGADKLSELACMETWPERRRVRRFPPDAKPGATHNEWAAAAAKRNAEMVAMRPDRAYCIHQSLDSSKGSRMTADMLQSAGLHFWHVKVSSAGAVLGVEYR